MRSFLSGQIARIEDEMRARAVRYEIAAILSGSALLLLAALREWPFPQHSVTLRGWLLIAVVLLFFAGVVASALLVIREFCGPRRWKYENGMDVKILLREYLHRKRPHVVGTQLTLHYDDIELQLDIKPGCVRKYFAAVAKETGGCQIVSEGRKTIQILFEPS